MTRTCTICEDPKHDEIDRRCRLEKDIAKIAKEFSLSYPALYRHISANHHIREATTIPTTAELATSEDIYKEIEKWHTEARDLQKIAKDGGDIKNALLGLDKALKCLELLSKIHGLIKEQNVNVNVSVNILESPEWIRIRSVLMGALQPYPEARQATSAALLRIDNRGRK